MIKWYCLLFGLLVKRFNTLPSHGSIHGFETHTGHQMDGKRLLKVVFITGYQAWIQMKFLDMLLIYDRIEYY